MSEITLIKCDNCGEQRDKHTIGINTFMQLKRSDWHNRVDFCSEKCLIEYLGKQQKKRDNSGPIPWLK